MDLFSTKIARNKLNHNFKTIYTDPKLAPVRAVINHGDADYWNAVVNKLNLLTNFRLPLILLCGNYI